MYTSFKQFLSESFNDRHIFKAIFIIGLPASGKTTFSKMLDCKTIDFDKYAEHFATKGGRNIDNEVSKFRDDAVDLPGHEFMSRLLSKSHHMMEIDIKNAVNAVLPLTISLVGTKAETKILAIKKQLESIGYDTFCVYIDQNEDLAKDGSRIRYQANLGSSRAARNVDEKYISVANASLQRELNLIKKEFGDNFSIIRKISNDQKNMFEQESYLKTIKECNAFLNSKIKNKIGQESISLFKTNSKEFKYLAAHDPDAANRITKVAAEIKKAQIN
jgi:hypothetical protein